MTRSEAANQFERLLANCAPPAEPDAVFAEWWPAFVGVPVDDVADGITRLLRGKTDRWFPSIGELRGSIASLQAGRDPREASCATCAGTRWIEARPYRANGEHVYEGVQRCPDCGVPAPRVEGAIRQTPLTAAELAQWRASRPAPVVIETRAAFLAAVRALAGPRVVARLAVASREPGEDG